MPKKTVTLTDTRTAVMRREMVPENINILSQTNSHQRSQPFRSERNRESETHTHKHTLSTTQHIKVTYIRESKRQNSSQSNSDDRKEGGQTVRAWNPE